MWDIAMNSNAQKSLVIFNCARSFSDTSVILLESNGYFYAILSSHDDAKSKNL